jgi:uncharacterized lipoprotein YajG
MKVVSYRMKRSTKTKALFATASIALLSGCAAYPLGLSKAEWEALPPQKQAEYRRTQTLADNQKRQDGESDRRYAEQMTSR